MNDQKSKKKIIRIISETISEFNMIRDKDSVLVAVSGGPDSVALILSLLAIQQKYLLQLGIAHLNHKLRGKESSRDEAFTRELADRLNLPFYGEQKDVSAKAKTHRLSIEEAGREARYDFFESIAKRHGYTKIATGHNKDDNAEQVLMNLLRGSGPKGLSGIPPIRDNRYIRPLIRVSKNQILDFLNIQQQAYVFDSSNRDMTYLRNKIRYRLIPHLQSEYNPEILESLDRLSHIIKQEETFWNIETQKAFHNCLIENETSFITFSNPELASLHPALLKRVLRKAIQIVKKDLNRISLAHINDIVAFCYNISPGLSLDLPGRIRVYRDKDSIMIKKEKRPLREIGKKEKNLRHRINKK